MINAEKKTIKSRLWIAAVCILLAACLVANDGRDRYAGPYAKTLRLFPDTAPFTVGYRVLPADAPGGADGDRAFRWAVPHGVALVRIAAFRTAKELGESPYPMAVFDLSAENGDSPVGFKPGRPPRGRHPGISHDGGINLDLGYYLTSLKGLHFSPDHSACSDHFHPQEAGAGGAPKDAYICNGPPDRLDVERQSYFLLQVLKLNRDLFAGELVEKVGMDWQIQQAVVKRVQEWVKTQKYGATEVYLADMKSIFKSFFEGRASYHHHHLHIRMGGESLFARYGAAFARLMEMERRIDRRLLQADAPPGQPVLRGQLLSKGMKRLIEAEILDVENVTPGARVRFRLDGGQWVSPDPGDWERVRAAISLPLAIADKSTTALLETEISRPGGKKRTARTAVVLPRLEPHMLVAVDSSQIRGTLERQGGRCHLRVSYPGGYGIYVTGVSFHIYRQEGGRTVTERHEVPKENPSYVFNEQSTPAIELIFAQVELSSRLIVEIPIYCAR